MSLENFWFIVVAVLFIGYFVLEGFDFGVGMLMPFLGASHTGGDEKVAADDDAATRTSAGEHCSTPSARCGTATRCGC